MKRLSVLLLVVPVLCSCLLLQQSRVRDRHIEPGYEERIGRVELVLSAVQVNRNLEAARIRDDATAIFRIVLAREAGRADRSEGSFRLEAVIKEERFVREFRNLNSVTVELAVFDPGGTQPVAIGLYSESSENTIDSYAYLHSVIRRAVRYLLR